MAITTQAAMLAGLQPPILFRKFTPGGIAFWKSTWAGTGNPGAGSYDTTLNGVTCDSTTTGALPWVNPASGNSYLTRFTIEQGNQASIFRAWLVDRLWHNGGYTITSTSAQNSTTPTWPARDANGSTNGEGVFVALELSAGAGAAAPTITVSYTNSDGTASRTGTNVVPTSNSPGTGSVYIIGWQGADKGVRSVQSVTLSASWLSGTMNMVAYRPIQYTTFPAGSAAGLNVVSDYANAGMPQIYNSPCLQFLWGSVNPGSETHSGYIRIAQG